MLHGGSYLFFIPSNGRKNLFATKAAFFMSWSFVLVHPQILPFMYCADVAIPLVASK